MNRKIVFGLSLLLAFALLVSLLPAKEMMETTLKINGMKCQNCVNQVDQALRSVKGVENVKVDLKRGTAKVQYAKANVADME
ncbi:MAG: heavy-metal-associated domain-containing protein, partial [Calditrichia bacterium]